MAMGTYFGYAPRRTSFKGRNYKYRSYPKVNKTVKKYVQKAIKVDKDINDVERTDQLDITETGRFVLLNGTAQGTSPEGHIGRDIKSVSIQTQGYVQNTDNVPHRCRVVWFIDNQCNKVTPTEEQLFNTSEFLLPENGGLFNQDYKKRFTVLRDMFFNLNPIGEPGSDKIIKYYKKLNNRVYYTEADSSTITAITKGALFCYLTSDDTDADSMVNCALSHLYKFTE